MSIWKFFYWSTTWQGLKITQSWNKKFERRLGSQPIKLPSTCCCFDRFRSSTFEKDLVPLRPHNLQPLVCSTINLSSTTSKKFHNPRNSIQIQLLSDYLLSRLNLTHLFCHKNTQVQVACTNLTSSFLYEIRPQHNNTNMCI